MIQIKDELLWPIGQFGYHEPPMELRQECINPMTKKLYTDRYRISLHNDRYGDLELEYYTDDGQRTLFTKGGGAKDKLMIIGENHPITIKEALEDLSIGDNIARNFRK